MVAFGVNEDVDEVDVALCEHVCTCCGAEFRSLNKLHEHLERAHDRSKKGRPLWADLANEEDAGDRIDLEEDAKAQLQDKGRGAERVLRVADDMKVVRNLLNSKADVAEAYSPPESLQRQRRRTWWEVSHWMSQYQAQIGMGLWQTIMPE